MEKDDLGFESFKSFYYVYRICEYCLWGKDK